MTTTQSNDSLDPTSPISDDKRSVVLALGDREHSHWNEVSAGLLKWLFATLITVNLGGMAYVITMGIHPEAKADAGSAFFGAMILALLSAFVEIVRVWRIKSFIFRLQFKDELGLGTATNRDFSRIFEAWYIPFFSLGLVTLSLVLSFDGGKTMMEATRPCSAEQFKLGNEVEDNVYPGAYDIGKCYFYTVEGLPNDPYQRAVFEEKIIKRLKEENIKVSR